MKKAKKIAWESSPMSEIWQPWTSPVIIYSLDDDRQGQCKPNGRFDPEI